MQQNIIDINSPITPIDHLLLHAYHAFLNHVPQQELSGYVFDNNVTERIYFYEELIEHYNMMLTSIDRLRFEWYISVLNEKQIRGYVVKFTTKKWAYEKPVIWKDRNKSDYYLRNLTDSHRFELFVSDKFLKNGFDIGLYYSRDGQYSGESKAGVEIKYDKRSEETGNLYIEIEESLTREQMFVSSGIFKEDNTKVIAIGNYSFIYFFEKNKLIELYQNIENYRDLRKVGAHRGTSKGFIIPIRLADNFSLSIEEVIDIIK